VGIGGEHIPRCRPQRQEASHAQGAGPD
jgi:hypothetical protein